MTPAELPSTVTHTWIPMSADAVGIVVEILVSVNSPVTSEGRMSSVTPLAFEVEMFALKILVPVPPPKTPPSPIEQEAPVLVALKLPLDCAMAATLPKASTSAIPVRIDPVFFMPAYLHPWTQGPGEKAALPSFASRMNTARRLPVALPTESGPARPLRGREEEDRTEPCAEGPLLQDRSQCGTRCERIGRVDRAGHRSAESRAKRPGAIDDGSTRPPRHAGVGQISTTAILRRGKDG